MKPMWQQSLAAPFIALVFLCSCGDSGPTPIYQGPPWPVACSVSTDCDKNQICNSKFNICVDTMPVDAALTFAIVPAGKSGAAADQFNDIKVTTKGRIDLTVAPAADISGYLFRSSHYRDSDEPGKLIAEAPGRIPGLHLRSEARTQINSDETARDETIWEMDVLPGIDYMMTFLPDDTTIPAGSWPVNVGMSGILDLELPDIETYFTVSGVVRHASGDSKIPVQGALVTATIDSKFASTCISDSNGIFRLSIPPVKGEITLDFKSGPDGPIFPGRTMRWEGLEQLEKSLPKTRFLVFDADPIPELLTITLQVLGVRDALSRIPMGGSQIFMEGNTGEGIFNTRTIVDANSLSTVIVPAGVYSVTVVPPSSGESQTTRAPQYSIAHRTTDLTNTGGRIFAIELPQRPKITGKLVYSGTQEPIAGGRIMMATVLDEVTDYTSAFNADLVHEVGTDAEGAFNMYLDPGRYAVRVEPPAGSGLAVASWPIVTISGTENLQIGLETGYALSGTVVSSLGKPLPDTLITFLFPTDSDFFDAWPFKEAGFSYSIRKAGETVTDINGKFEIILPGPDVTPTAIGAVFTAWQ